MRARVKWGFVRTGRATECDSEGGEDTGTAVGGGACSKVEANSLCGAGEGGQPLRNPSQCGRGT